MPHLCYTSNPKQFLFTSNAHNVINNPGFLSQASIITITSSILDNSSTSLFLTQILIFPLSS